MKRLAVAGIIAAASVLSLAGCSGGSASASCSSSYTQEKAIAYGLRSIIQQENQVLAQYVGGSLSADETATKIDTLTTALNTLNTQEAAIKACS